jgi:hypothetical protein
MPVRGNQLPNITIRPGHAQRSRIPATAPGKRPQDPDLDGTGLTFEPLEHGGEYPDTMPQAIRLTDARGRSAVYVPIKVRGKVVDSLGFTLARGPHRRK